MSGFDLDLTLERGSQRTMRRGWRASWTWLAVASAVLVTLSAAQVSSAFSHNLNGALPVVGTRHAHFEAGSYVVYQDAEDGSFPLPPTSLWVVGAHGQVQTYAKTTWFGYQTPWPSLNKTAYENIIGFTIPTSGTYLVSGRGPSLLLTARSNGWVALDAIPWFVGIALGLTGIAGSTLLYFRSRRITLRGQGRRLAT